MSLLLVEPGMVTLFLEREGADEYPMIERDEVLRMSLLGRVQVVAKLPLDNIPRGPLVVVDLISCVAGDAVDAVPIDVPIGAAILPAEDCPPEEFEFRRT